MKKTLLVIAVATSTLFIQSCNKHDVASPAPVQELTTSQDELSAARTSPAPGNYKVKLYIDDNDTSTSTFKGYVFTFKSNGVLTAKINNSTYTGTWEMKDGGTEMKIDIEGTPALDRIDKSWDVVSITNTLITLTDNDPGEVTKLVFRKI